MTFERALALLKHGFPMTRKGWGDQDIYVDIQYPDKNSKMTEPYIYMYKRGKRFPLDLSVESILADDWEICEVEVRHRISDEKAKHCGLSPQSVYFDEFVE